MVRRAAPQILIPLTVALALSASGRAVAGETACWFENGAIVAPGVIADMAGDYVIDLSAPQTLLHDTRAQAGGYAQTRLILSVRVAGQTVADAPVVVRDLDGRGAGFATPIAGVIGADILGRYVLSLDFAPCRLRLEPPGNSANPSGRSLEVTMIGGAPTVQAAASDGDHGLRGAFALDTASKGGVRARGEAEAPRQRPVGTLSALSLDGVVYRRLRAVVAGDLPDGVVGALGVDILSAYSLRLDPLAGRLWLTPTP